MKHNAYTELFNSLSPIRSDEELLNAIYNERTKSMKKPSLGRKAIAIAIAATIGLGGTAVGVAAANGLNVAEIFESFFRSKQLTTSAEQTVFDFDSYGTPIDHIEHFDDFDLHIWGIACDDQTLVLLLDVISNVTSAENIDPYIMPSITLAESEEQISNSIYTSAYKYDGNVRSYCVYAELDSTDITGKTARINIDPLNDGKGFDVECRIPEQAPKKNISTNEQFRFYNYSNAKLCNISYSPLSFNAEIDITSATVDSDYSKNEVTFVLTDGTRVSSGTYSWSELNGKIYFNAIMSCPADIDNIAQIYFNDAAITLKEQADTTPAPDSFDFDRYTIPIGERYEGEGFTLTMDGYLADSSTVALLYSIDFNDSFPYEYAHEQVYDEGWFDWYTSTQLVLLNDTELNCSSGANVIAADEDSVLICAYLSTDTDTFNNGDDLTVSFGELIRNYYEEPTLTDKLTIDIDADFEINLSLIDKEPRTIDFINTYINTLSMGNVRIDNISISPLSVEYTVTPQKSLTLEDFTELFNASRNELSPYHLAEFFNGGYVDSNSIKFYEENGSFTLKFTLPSYPIDPDMVWFVNILGEKQYVSAHPDNVYSTATFSTTDR